MPEKPFSIIDLGPLSEPIKKLIETVSSAMGTLYEPTRIRRKAKAEADAQITLAKSKVKEQAILQRAQERLTNREIRRQNNIESIIKKAAQALPPHVDPKPVDEDWTCQFISSCEDIGNSEMQILWAKILAGEVTSPGRYSLRTLQVVKSLRRIDAELFTKFCSFVWLTGQGFMHLRLGNDEILKNHGINTRVLLHLSSLGLLQASTSLQYQILDTKKETKLIFHENRYLAKFPEDKSYSNLPCYILTDIGSELAPISGSDRSPEYENAIIDFWRGKNVAIRKIAATDVG